MIRILPDLRAKLKLPPADLKNERELWTKFRRQRPFQLSGKQNDQT
jgi:hypothetical protein